MTYRVPEALAFLEDPVNDMTWVVQPDDGVLHGLSLTAGIIWWACDGEPDVAAVVSRVCTEWEWPPEEIAPHVERLVEDLLVKRLIEEES